MNDIKKEQDNKKRQKYNKSYVYTMAKIVVGTLNGRGHMGYRFDTNREVGEGTFGICDEESTFSFASSIVDEKKMHIGDLLLPIVTLWLSERYDGFVAVRLDHRIELRPFDYIPKTDVDAMYDDDIVYDPKRGVSVAWQEYNQTLGENNV